MEFMGGVVSAIFLLLFRESFTAAQSQKEIAGRLRVYIDHWQYEIAKEKNCFSGLAYIGIKWQETLKQKVNKGMTIEEFSKVNTEFEDKLNEMFQKISENGEDVDRGLKEGFDKFLKNPDLKKQLLKLLDEFRASIVNGVGFITDQDAAKLGPAYSRTCVEIKSHLVSFTISFSDFILFIQREEDIKYSNYRVLFEPLFRNYIYASREMELLASLLKGINNKRLLNLATQNFFHGL